MRPRYQNGVHAAIQQLPVPLLAPLQLSVIWPPVPTALLEGMQAGNVAMFQTLAYAGVTSDGDE